MLSGEFLPSRQQPVDWTGGISRSGLLEKIEKADRGWEY
jgi:hypothetical protein